MRILHQSRHKRRMRLLQRLLHKPRHQHITPQINILPQPKPILRHILTITQPATQTQLGHLTRLTRHIPTERPLVANLDAHRREHVRLQTRSQVVEAGGVADLAVGDATW